MFGPIRNIRIRLILYIGLMIAVDKLKDLLEFRIDPRFDSCGYRGEVASLKLPGQSRYYFARFHGIQIDTLLASQDFTKVVYYFNSYSALLSRDVSPCYTEVGCFLYEFECQTTHEYKRGHILAVTNQDAYEWTCNRYSLQDVSFPYQPVISPSHCFANKITPRALEVISNM